MHQMLALAFFIVSGPAEARPDWVVDAERRWDVVFDAERRCIEAAKGPAPAPMVRLPVEKFDSCIAAEANKWPMETRKAICARGTSGGPYKSTVEVYMTKEGQCRTDFE
jgi:hypothetical protein